MNLEQIQQAISDLSDVDYNLLTKWMTEHDFLRWDRQIVDDLNSGRLDQLIDEVTQEYKNGETKPL